MTEDAFIILETTTKPKPLAKPKPLIAAPIGRTMADLSPAQKSRAYRRQHGPFFCEPIYVEAGATGYWRTGRILGSEERLISEGISEAESTEWLRKEAMAFYANG